MEKQNNKGVYLTLTIVFLIAAATILAACGNYTKGVHEEPYDGESSSSDDGGTLSETVTPTSVASTDASQSSTTAEPPDVTTGASVGTASETSEASSGSESSGGGEASTDTGSSSTGDNACDAEHCGQECSQDSVYDPKTNACICAPLCFSEEECGGSAECLGGRCALACETDDDCPCTMLCGTMHTGWKACMYGEPG